jgi:hypothetical protein
MEVGSRGQLLARLFREAYLPAVEAVDEPPWFAEEPIVLPSRRGRVA